MSNEKYFINPHESNFQGYCPNCQHELYHVLPIQPVFAAVDAHKFIPMPYRTFKNWLSKHDKKLSKPNLYRRDNNRRMHRYLTAADIRIIRDYVFSTKLPSGKFKRISELYTTLQNTEFNDNGRTNEASAD